MPTSDTSGCITNWRYAAAISIGYYGFQYSYRDFSKFMNKTAPTAPAVFCGAALIHFAAYHAVASLAYSLCQTIHKEQRPDVRDKTVELLAGVVALAATYCLSVLLEVTAKYFTSRSVFPKKMAAALNTRAFWIQSLTSLFYIFENLGLDSYRRPEESQEC